MRDLRPPDLELRGAIEAAAEVSVPEPSPLFWNHLSERVRTAVAEEHALSGQVSCRTGGGDYRRGSGHRGGGAPGRA